MPERTPLIVKESAEQSFNQAASRKPIRVAFFVYPTAFQSPGGGEVQLMKTKEYLEKEGVEVRLFDTWKDKLRDFDLLHVFGSVKDCLPIMETARVLGVKSALSTICWYSWKSAWWTYPSPKDRAISLIRHGAKEFLPFMPSRRKKMMHLAHVLLPNSQSEADQLKRYFGADPAKIHVVPNGVDQSFAYATPDAFLEKYRIKDFVLCVGRIEPRKNQLGMIRALRGSKFPLVFIGDNVPSYRSYYEACRREAGPNVHFLGAIPHDSPLLASAYAACNTFLLASWLETPGLAALEAGLSGAKIVITREGATTEYFGDHAAYVSPENPANIREVTEGVYARPKDSRLKEWIASRYGWNNAARETLSAYRQVFKYREASVTRSAAKSCRIGYDLQASQGELTGLGVYAANLADALVKESDGKIEWFFYEKKSGRPWTTVDRMIWGNITVPMRSNRDRLDLLHVPAFAAPVLSRTRLVVTVHDLIERLYPNQLGKASQFYWGTWLPWTASRADAIIAQSESTKNDIVTYLGIDPEKVHVIYPAGNPVYFPLKDKRLVDDARKRFAIRDSYFLAVGTLEPRKNLHGLLNAYLKFIQKHKDARIQLVIVGSKSFARGKYYHMLQPVLADNPNVIFTGYIDTQTLNALYNGALAFVYPSFYEGFGMPLVEAMSAGAPVITSNRSSLPEVAADAAYYISPSDTDWIMQGLEAVAFDAALRADLIRKGSERSKKFSWSETARQTLNVYQSVLR